MDRLRAIMKIQAAMMLGSIAVARIGLISAYNPNRFAAKVQLQPENVETGWLPIATLFGGNGWGAMAAPVVGNQCVVLFQEGRQDVGLILAVLYSIADQPPGAPAAGEFWLTHSTGSLLKVTKDGKIAITSNGDMNLTAGGNMNLNAGGSVNIDANTNVTGTLKASVDVQGGSEPVSLVTHKHTLVQPGSGVSGPPQ